MDCLFYFTAPEACVCPHGSCASFASPHLFPNLSAVDGAMFTTVFSLFSLNALFLGSLLWPQCTNDSATALFLP
jgi:hypothetical protein